VSEYLISSGGAVLACARCNAEWTGTGHVCTDLAAMKRALDAADADRDYWRAQATMAAPCVDAVRAITLRLIPGGTGCAVDPERVVAAVDGLRAECDRIDRLASRQAGEYMEAAHGLASELDAARAEAAGLRAIAEAADELVFCDYAAEVESYSETAPGSHAAAQVRAAEAYDALVKLRDAWRERQPTPTPALGATGEGR